jgi:hypothetical protein
MPSILSSHGTFCDRISGSCRKRPPWPSALGRLTWQEDRETGRRARSQSGTLCFVPGLHSFSRYPPYSAVTSLNARRGADRCLNTAGMTRSSGELAGADVIITPARYSIFHVIVLLVSLSAPSVCSDLEMTKRSSRLGMQIRCGNLAEGFFREFRGDHREHQSLAASRQRSRPRDQRNG